MELSKVYAIVQFILVQTGNPEGVDLEALDEMLCDQFPDANLDEIDAAYRIAARIEANKVKEIFQNVANSNLQRR